MRNRLGKKLTSAGRCGGWVGSPNDAVILATMDSVLLSLFVLCVLLWLAPWHHPIVPITMFVAFVGGVLRLYTLWSHPAGWYTT